MTASPREAFAALRLDWARTPEDVWRTSAVHVEGLHVDAARGIEAGIADAVASDDSSPIGVVVQGQRGSGKTHLLGWVRERVHSLGGYFFLVGPLSGTSFWESVAGSMVENLLRDVDGQGSQLAVFLRRCSDLFGVSEEVRAGVVGDTELAPEHLKDFIVGLRQYDRRLGSDCQDTLRAMVLYGAADYVAQDVGQCYLQSMEEQEPGERAHRGMRTPPKPAQQIVKEISRLLALTGPSVIAIDQIDTVIAETMSSGFSLNGESDGQHPATLFDQIADGLLVLRDVTARTLCVVSCLPTTWMLIEKYALGTVRDRFRELTALNRIGTPEIGRQLVEKRFADCFRTIYFRAPHPTWPVRASAFDDATQYTPRNLIQHIDRHVQACLATGAFVELEKFQNGEGPEIIGPFVDRPDLDQTDGPEFAAFDKQFDELRRAAEIGDVLVPENEDVAVPRLLAAGLTAWIAERGPDRDVFAQDPLPGRKPVLHARLRQALDDDAGDETHWAFRAITSDQAISALNRIRAAATKAGIDQSRGKRRLYLLRNTEWSKGARTQEAIEAFTAAGGVTLALTDDDLRTFSALEQMLAEKRAHVQDWLLARRPASGTRLLRTVLPATTPATPNTTPATPKPNVATPKPTVVTPKLTMVTPHQPEIPRITIGRALTDQAEARVDLESLRRHTVIFAGSGSGKTVLIRRLVEECALRGVSSVVLDPNNDLARLGDAWPRPPAQWAAGDAELAEKYLAETDVVVWTPKRTKGRPLTFQPLPDFREILDDPDELEVAIDAAVVTLAARANVAGTGVKATKGQAVLRQALGHFARSERTGLTAFLELLADLPDGVSSLADAWKVAGDLGEALKAVMVIDPLFGGLGEPVDPGVLLTPPAGKRARVSVISLVGLPGDEQRQAFVNQLQMALFAWVKKNPAGDRPLGGLFVMDEAQTFAPSSGSTPCTKSTLALAAQARKYGLGLVFATQAPKGLHNYIPANATTQFFGLLNAPVQIAAAQEMAKAKGGDASDIARLKVGQFYAAGEGVRLRKLQTPLCLSHHPKSPLTAEEVVDRAAGRT